MSSICIVTPFHVAFQPRARREADALAAAGYDVRVVAVRTDATLDEYDDHISGGRRWRLDAVDLSAGRATRARRWRASLRRRVALGISATGIPWTRAAAIAAVRGAPELAARAAAEPADLVIAHTHATLEPAAAAARSFGAPLAFDCEDLLGDTAGSDARAMRILEAAHIGSCEYVSVPSRAMAHVLEGRYQLGHRLVVLENVFPLAQAASLVSPRMRPSIDAPLRLHWFGQTAGADRGLDDVCEALQLMSERAELHIRGRISPQAAAALARRAGDAALRVRFHARVPPDDLIATLGAFDVGLACERPSHGSYGVTLTNKVFSYLLAGLAIAATDTAGQRELMTAAPGIGFLYPAGDAAALACRLDMLARDRAALRHAQQTAWDAARATYCWDIVERRFLDGVAAIMASRPVAAPAIAG